MIKQQLNADELCGNIRHREVEVYVRHVLKHIESVEVQLLLISSEFKELDKRQLPPLKLFSPLIYSRICRKKYQSDPHL